MEKKCLVTTGRGKGEISGKTSLFKYEVVQTQEDIPDTIWSKIKLSNWRNIFSFDQRDYDPEAFYVLIVGGEDLDTSYNIAFEQVRYSESPRDDSPYNATVSLVMRQ